MNNDFINQDILDIIIERDGYKEQSDEYEKEIERLNNIINELRNENEKLYDLCETNNICYLQGLEDSEKIKEFNYSDFVKKWLKDMEKKLKRGDVYEQINNNRKEQ